MLKNAPIYLEKAASIPQNNVTQALQRFKMVVTFAISVRHLAAQMKKPFNPILGETYQASCGQYKIALEQISHHPPISAYILWSEKSTKFRCFGSLEQFASTGSNSALAQVKGPLTVEFEGGHSI